VKWCRSGKGEKKKKRGCNKAQRVSAGPKTKHNTRKNFNKNTSNKKKRKNEQTTGCDGGVCIWEMNRTGKTDLVTTNGKKAYQKERTRVPCKDVRGILKTCWGGGNQIEKTRAHKWRNKTMEAHQVTDSEQWRQGDDKKGDGHSVRVRGWKLGVSRDVSQKSGGRDTGDTTDQMHKGENGVRGV